MKKNLLITCVMLLFAVVSMAQNKITVSGVVSDKTGMTVIGATVSVKGAPQQGVVTGLDGDYKITNVPSKGDKTKRFTLLYVGFTFISL